MRLGNERAAQSDEVGFALAYRALGGRWIAETADGNDRNVQFGLVLGLTYKWLALSTYVFNPTESKPTVVVSLSLTL